MLDALAQNWWGQKFSKLLTDYRLTKIPYKLSHESKNFD